MYRAGPFDTIVRLSDGMVIPTDPANRDRQMFEQWVADGHAPLPVAVADDPVPAISKAQCLLWLLQLGKTEADVDAFIEAIPDPTDREIARIEWRHRSIFRHDHPLMVAAADAFGLQADQLPDAFRAASAL
ncbi:hypothetical protein CH341_30470 [Rhodoplanes roseus]|uniref:Uncharacterized protein n=1 Tax=Rhodoplanes roseus TaxID=29409 RepID=A0A327KBR7_9BRAD|nr:hypothetical protein CH341_30470 [Rhodoplanes roseus]